MFKHSAGLALHAESAIYSYVRPIIATRQQRQSLAVFDATVQDLKGILFQLLLVFSEASAEGPSTSSLPGTRK
jgi:hypothetical protein